MNEYNVTIRLVGRDQFLNFIDTIGSVAGAIMVNVKTSEGVNIPESEPVSAPAPVRRHGPPRGARGSKVNDTILGAMSAGPQTIKQLKEALVAVGMAAGSLSTGLATLQKTKQVERVGEGLYGRTFAKAAE